MFRVRTESALLVAWLAICGSMGVPPAAHAQEGTATGSVSGRVLETDGTPIPRVLVVLAGPAPATTPLRVRADENASFLFENLTPGTYRLAVELPGLAAPGDTEVVVTAGETVRADAVLSLFAYDVEVRVTGRVPQDNEVLRSDSTSGDLAVDGPLLTQLPLPAEQVLEVLPLLPGVVRGPSGLVSIGGSLPADSAFLFNGADLIDPFSGEYRMQVPLEAVDNIQLSRGAYAATYGDNIGGVVDVATAGAGEEWSNEIASLIPRPWFRDGSLAGIRRFSPRIRFGGPLVPGRLYFSQSIEYRLDRERVRDVPDNRGDHVFHEGWESLTQIDWRPQSSPHRLSLMLLAFPESENNAGLSALTPVDATSEISRSAAALLAEHRFRFDDRSALSTTIQLNRVSALVGSGSFGADGLDVFPDGFDGVAFHRGDRATRHWQIRTSYSRVFGGPQPRHSLQIGLDAHGLSTSGNVDNVPIEIRGADGDILERTVFVGGDNLRGSKREFSVFVQERYRPSSRFWVDVGVRASYDGAARSFRTAPRFGVAWDVRGDTRTLLKLSSGLLFRRIFLGEMLWEQQPTRVVTTFADSGAATTAVLAPRVDSRLRSPRAWVGSVELSHRFSDSWTLSGRFAKREARNRLVFDLDRGTEIVHAADADPLVIAGDIDADARGSLALANVGEISYQEIELTASWRARAGHQMFLSYVRSRARGDLNDFGRVVGEMPDPVLRRNAYARLPFDAPNRLVLWGRLYLPWDLIVAPVVEWRSGFPWSELDESQDYAGVASNRRFPTYLRADINVTKGFRLAGRQLRLGLQLQNLTNRHNPRDVIASNASDRFGHFFNARGLRIRFRSSARF